ncbi:hypothetical protein BDQ17DRAFT_1423092 [Cyathus striatus]|nr:hypothetical protein BDQ17DRAFT_1423092 [Cyathus striatus]
MKLSSTWNAISSQIIDALHSFKSLVCRTQISGAEAARPDGDTVITFPTFDNGFSNTIPTSYPLLHIYQTTYTLKLRVYTDFLPSRPSPAMALMNIPLLTTSILTSKPISHPLLRHPKAEEIVTNQDGIPQLRFQFGFPIFWFPGVIGLSFSNQIRYAAVIVFLGSHFDGE